MENVKNDLVEWTKLFPRQASEDCISSGAFIKQLTKIIISSIAYLKDAFPEDSYTVENFAGLNIRVLKNKCRDGDANFLITSLNDAFDAFDKRYLHQLALYFYENECRVEEIIESHVFEYTYKGDTASMNVSSQTRGGVKTNHSFQNIFDQTTHILKTYVVLMNSERRLPLTYSISLRLNYNEDTPAGYHAPGFECDDDDVGHLSHNASLKVGTVSTAFHRLRLISYFKGDSRSEAIGHNSEALTKVCEQSEDLSETGDRIACPCNKKDSKNGPSELLTCHFLSPITQVLRRGVHLLGDQAGANVYCNTRQHASCFGILSTEVGQVTQHCCATCHDAEPERSYTDLRLAGLSHKARASLSMFRRSLEWCVGLKTVDVPTLGVGLHATRTEAIKLLKMLQLQGVIVADDDTDLNKPQRINTDRLNSVITKYFNRKDTVGRLLAEIETSISQEEFRLSDPIGEVLDPVQRLEIQNISNIGRVISKPLNKPVVEDSTLKQYKEALVLDEIQEPDFSCSLEIKSNKRQQKTPTRASLGKKKARI